MYLSLTQSLFPLGQGISQPVASVMVKKLHQIKIVLISAIIIAIAGNVTYMVASKVDSVTQIILGRVLAGLGAGERGQLFIYPSFVLKFAHFEVLLADITDIALVLR